MQRRSYAVLAIRRRLATVLLLVFSLMGSGLLPALSSAQAGSGAIDPAAINQIAALLAEKDARTPAEQKVDSNLLYAIKQQVGISQSAAAASLQTDVAISAGQTTIVDITAFVSDGMLAQIAALGGKVLSSYPEYRSIRAELPISQVLTVAGWNLVIFIQPKQQATTNHVTLPAQAARVATSPLFMTPLGQLPTHSVRRLAGQPIGSLIGQVAPISVTQGITSTSASNRSEGDVAHRANLARQTYGYSGAGVKTCVLSDGVDALTALQASGDLPAVTVVPDQAGTGNEGGAMLEIVYDLAPGAQLFYASAFNGIASFASNIKTLRNTYGCNVIVDDVAYFAETPFQLGQAANVISTNNSGIVAQAVNDVVASGASYFSSAGNSGNLNDGTAGVWEGDFVSAGPLAAPITGIGNVLDFDPTAGAQGYNTVTASSSGPVTLFWSDPLGGSSNDYDLFLLNSAGNTVLSASTNLQNGTQDPFEITSVSPATGNRIVVVQRIGADGRYLHINTNRGQLQFATSGQTGGHAAALQGFGVAAANAQNPAVVFNGSTVVENFSSDGLRRYFFNPNSTAVTPGNFSSTGGAVVQKPDLTAADGVSCASPGFNPFFGTSAAAPHAAAIATLLRSAKPSITNAELRTILTSSPTAIDIEAPGADRDSGAGVLNALAALQTLGQPAVPLLSTSLRFSEGPLRNNNGVIEAGETFAITVPVTNTTLAAATNVQLSLELLNPVPGVQIISPTTTSYGTLAANGSTASNTASPFLVSVSPSVACGTKLDFKMTATYGGGGSNSPQVLLASVMLGKQLVINTTLDTTAPPSSAIAPAYTASTGAQIGRLARTGIVSNCSASSANPGLNTAVGARRYDAYTFTNTAATAVCITVTLTTPQNDAASGLYAAVYDAGGFVPATPNIHYLADSGLVGVPNTTTPATFSFLAPAGQPFTIVVHEVGVGGGTGAGLGAYSLNVTGSGFGICAAAPAQATTMAATAGGGQRGRVGVTFVTQLQATVRDSGGNPVPGVGVTFSGPGSGAGITFPNGPIAVTNASGQATIVVRANNTRGTYNVTANTSNGALATAVTFSLTNVEAVYLPLVMR